eukprot:6188649-Pleurochrysis_carterae.AAC.2
MDEEEAGDDAVRSEVPLRLKPEYSFAQMEQARPTRTRTARGARTRSFSRAFYHSLDDFMYVHSLKGCPVFEHTHRFLAHAALFSKCAARCSCGNT